MRDGIERLHDLAVHLEPLLTVADDVIGGELEKEPGESGFHA